MLFIRIDNRSGIIRLSIIQKLAKKNYSKYISLPSTTWEVIIIENRKSNEKNIKEGNQER